MALKRGQYEYVSLIDKMTVDYITNERSIRRQMALNGFDFADASLLTPTSGHDLFTYAAKSEEENGGTRSELAVFLELVDEYQSRIEHFHKAVETNDYHAVKSRYLIDDMTVDTSLPFAIGDLFTLNLIHSKRKVETITNELCIYYLVFNCCLIFVFLSLKKERKSNSAVQGRA